MNKRASRSSQPRPARHFLLSDDALELVSARFRVLGDPSRLRLLNLLMQGERSVQDLVEASGQTQTNVSRHLGLLRRERVVARDRHGTRAVYRITDASVMKLCQTVCGGLSEQLAGGLEALQGEGI